MTLRLRLVLALVALLTVGLALFGLTTYSFYARSERQRLDDQLVSAIPLVTTELRQAAGQAAPGPTGRPERGHGGPDDRGRSGPPVVVAPGTYAELRTGAGAIVANGAIQANDQTSQPSLPAVLKAEGRGRRFFDADSASGSASWRVVVSPDESGDQTVVVATPLTEVRDALDRLVIIEAAAALALLSLLAAGSWLILRRGLHPLEEMAAKASTITAGDLSQRVAPADGTEVGQLGLALNTMLGEIEDAFREREETERRLRRFLADASHELRTPLTSIQGFAELFRLGADSEHVDRAVIMRRIEEESARMKTLVEDLLLLARLDQTRTAERAPVDLAVLAADACSDAVAAAPGRRVTLEAPVPVVVLGDRDHLRQAIANLVTNAVHHTPAATPIDVAARVDADAAVVEVRDRGPGLDQEALAHVFDRFWQADAARVGSGAGLGLAIVAGIASEHGGSATAGNAEDGGARFSLRLPLPAVPVPPAAAADRETARPRA